MERILTAVAVLACFSTLAVAGPNAGGTLIIVTDGLIYCADDEPYCGSGSIQDCRDGVTRVDGASLNPVVLNVLAAFHESTSPRLSGVTFGIAYNSAEVFIAALFSCGDFELPDGDWPVSGTGTAVTWNAAQTGQINDVYWIAAYNYYGNPNQLGLIPHPSQGASFADDSIPPEIDPIAGLGAFGFDTEGDLPCTEPDLLGACCDIDRGDCTVTAEFECVGDWLLGQSCEPNPCPEPPLGACCDPGTGGCSMRTQAECEDLGREWHAEPCDETPCVGTPVIESTWGEVKTRYR